MNTDLREPIFDEEKEQEVITAKDDMIGKIADLLREHRERAFDNYQIHSKYKKQNPKIKAWLKQGGELSSDVELTTKAEKNFVDGIWDKETIKGIEHLILDYIPDQPSDPAEKKQWEAERKRLINLIEENKDEISKEEITKVLRKKKAKEETEAEIKE